MRVTIELSGIEELARVLELLKVLHIDGISVHTDQMMEKGDKTLGGADLFGMWSENPRNLDELRQKSWKRDWK